MDSIEFLNAIFGDAIGDSRNLVLWSYPDRHTEQFTDVAKAVQYAGKRAKDTNIYFGLSLVKGVTEGRGKYEHAAAIGCVWADIDIAGPIHDKNKKAPPDLRAAQAILDRVGLKPSITVHSGYGLHCYWLLKEPWVFENEGDKTDAAALAIRWHATVCAIAGTMGWHLENLGDLTRVLRVPGTFNHKDPEHVAEVRILEAPGLRYAQDDFDPFLIAPEFVEDKAGRGKLDFSTVQVGAVTLDAAAEPPALKLLALLENDIKFRRAWKRNRPDLQDQSASSYDMSLANLAVLAGWLDQEIANLLIAWRRENKEDLAKAMRRDYIMRTIAKAKAPAAAGNTLADLAKEAEEAAAIATAAKKAEDPATTTEAVDPERRKKIFAELSKRLGIPIARWIQHGAENARYSLELSDGRTVRIGGVDQVLSADKFRNKVYEATGRLIPAMKRDTWDDVARCLSACKETVENAETTSGYQAMLWVGSYLSDHPLVANQEWQEAASNSQPFLKEGKIHVHAQELRKHMRVLQHETQINHTELCDALRVCGYVREDISFRHEGEVYRRSFWSIGSALAIASGILRDKAKAPKAPAAAEVPV